MEDKNIPDKMRRRGGGAIFQGPEWKEADRTLDQDKESPTEEHVQRRDSRCLLKDEKIRIEKQGQCDSN